MWKIRTGKEDYHFGRFVVLETKRRYFVFYTIRPHSMFKGHGGFAFEITPKTTVQAAAEEIRND